MSDYSPEEIQRILAEAREEKLGYLRGKGWTDAQIAAYFAGRRGVGWLPPYWKYPSSSPLATRAPALIL